MTLLLGPPSSGKTTLLLALAGKLDQSLRVSRLSFLTNHHVIYIEQNLLIIWYLTGERRHQLQWVKLNEFVPQKSSAYISQNDVHVGEMTVRETLDFSARCLGVGSRYGN